MCVSNRFKPGRHVKACSYDLVLLGKWRKGFISNMATTTTTIKTGMTKGMKTGMKTKEQRNTDIN